MTDYYFFFCVGVGLEPLEVIAEYMLQYEWSDFVLQFRPTFDRYGRVFTHFVDACFFETLCEKVSEVLGEDVVPIVLDLNIDSAPVGGYRKRSIKPVNMSFKNLCPTATKQVMTMGYAPIHPYTTAELHQLLQPFIASKSNRKSFITFMKKHVDYFYVRQLVDCVLRSQKTPYLMACKGDLNNPRKVSFFIAPFVNDNEEAYKLLGCSYRSNMPCRRTLVPRNDITAPATSIFPSTMRTDDLEARIQFTRATHLTYYAPANARRNSYLTQVTSRLSSYEVLMKC